MPNKRAFICQPCLSGMVPGKQKAYNPRCYRCREKLAAGMRTGDEPLPVDVSPFKRRSIGYDEFMKMIKKEQENRAAQKEHYKGLATR